MAELRCTMCGGLGWVLDCNDLGKPGPRMVELIECFHPECEVGQKTIQSICFKGQEFRHVSKHPATGVVMSVSRGPEQVGEATHEDCNCESCSFSRLGPKQQASEES